MRSLVVLFAAATLIVGCGGGRFGNSGASKADHVLHATIPTNLTKLDPAQVEDGDTIEVLNQIFEGLVQYNEHNELQPNLAESWTVSEDGLTFTFKIKKGVKFHSGREMTAEDVKYSWDRAATKEVLSPTVEGYMMDIVGFAEAWAGTADGLSGVKVIDAYTLEVKILHPKGYFPMYLQYPCYFVVDREKVAKTPITSVENMIGTGPFRITEYKENQQVVLERFEDYHGGAPKLEKIVRLIAKDPQTRRSLYESGRADWVALERQDKAFVDQNEELKQALQVVDRAAIWYLGFGLKAYEQFKDARVRKAFAMAVDKDRIINEGFDGINVRADGIIPPSVPGFDPDFKGLPYDPAAAKALLAEAGFPNGQGLKPIKFYFRADRADPKIVAEMVAQDLDKNLGVKVELAPTEWKALLEMRSKGELGFFHLRWGADYLDPQNFLSFMLHTNARENTLGYSNPVFDAICEKADKLPLEKKDERFNLYREAQKIAVVDDAIWIPIYFQRDLELVRPGVEGIRRSAMGPLPHTETDVVWSR